MNTENNLFNKHLNPETHRSMKITRIAIVIGNQSETYRLRYRKHDYVTEID